MKLATFHLDSEARLGAVLDGEIADLADGNDRLPASLRALLDAGVEGLEAAAAAIARARRFDLAEVRLAPPIPDPRKFLGLGLSFKSHVEEIKARGVPIPITGNQVWFNKQVTAVNGPYDPIHLPRVSDKLDYEGEVALVIGRRGRHIARDDAHRFIAGYMICNDVSVRDWQMRAPTAHLGKSFDTHGPTGPWLSTPDEIDDPENLGIRTWVDGELRQDGRTSDFIYSIGEMLEELSTVFTLEPGDILTTGSPSGVGALFDPPRFLAVGQKVRIEVDGLGHIENEVIAEPAGDGAR
jgi:2-keto-4-pentenoate hydratase/2-oxohepta-3-ene-1,7-dioic acid hydratase in catechol pathway